MTPPSNRPRSLRELNPSLFVGSRRHRARDAAGRASAALSRFLGRLLRQQGEDWRVTCDDLRRQLAAAKKERDGAVKAHAAAVEASAQAAAERHALANRVSVAEGRLALWARRMAYSSDADMRALVRGAAGDPDPRQGRPGAGAELLPNRVPDMRPRPAAGQGSGPGGAANAFTSSAPAGDDKDETTLVCAVCGKDLIGGFLRDPDKGDIHIRCGS